MNAVDTVSSPPIPTEEEKRVRRIRLINFQLDRGGGVRFPIETIEEGERCHYTLTWLGGVIMHTQWGVRTFTHEEWAQKLAELKAVDKKRMQ